MKMTPLRLAASLVLFALTACMAVFQPAMASVCLFAGSLAIMPLPANVPQGAFMTVTLTPAVLLLQTMRALTASAPALNFFSREFTTERVKKGQTVTGKMRLRPAIRQYAGNYETNAEEGRDLLVDVGPFTMDQHIYTTVKMSDIYALQDKISDLNGHFRDQAEEIGKSVSRYFLGKVNSAAFSNASTYSTANSDKDALEAIRFAMNERFVPGGRFGLINTSVASTLTSDDRITNRYDGASRDTDTNHLVSLRGLAGFANINEDDSLSSGNGDAITASGIATTDLITTSAAHGLVVNQRVKFSALGGGGAGLTTTDYYFVQSVPSTTTLKVSATRGGAAVDVTTAYTSATFATAENITGFFGTREAIAIKTALPTDGIDAAEAFGIPVPVSSEVITDPATGLSMIAYKWFKTGSMDAYMTLAVMYGGVAGAYAASGSEVMEPCGHILRSA
jgi:hypothetical protein